VPKDKIEIQYKNDKNYAIINDKKYEFNLLGGYQKENLALALAAVENTGLNIKDETIANALKNVNWIFRLQYDKQLNTLIDGAHNPSGIKVLREFLDENFKTSKKKFYFGCLKNKDYKTMLEILLKQEDEIYFSEFSHENALKYDEIPVDLKEKYAIKKACPKDEFIKKYPHELKIFCGSLYMLGEIFAPKS